MHPDSHRHVLAVIDLGLGSQHVVVAAAEIARSQRAALTLLHVVDYAPPVGADFLLLTPTAERNAMVQAAGERLRAMATRAGVRAEVRVVTGVPDVEAARIAGELKTDLVVVGGWRARLAALFGVGADCLAPPAQSRPAQSSEVQTWKVVRV